MKFNIITYRTPKGIVVTGTFIKTLYGYRQIVIGEEILDKSNTIIKIEKLEMLVPGEEK